MFQINAWTIPFWILRVDRVTFMLEFIDYNYICIRKQLFGHPFVFPAILKMK